MNELPTLYKKTSTGKIQTWRIWVDENVMYSESGQLEGKKILTKDEVKEGKNIGKANETTASQQAEKEAEARWISKKKKGYVEQVTDAEENKVSDLVEGGFLPMLAKSFSKDGDHIVFPCAGQPKLDGIRCVYNSGDNIWTRTRKEILGVPHIPKFILKNKINLKFSKLDGELYNHSLRNDFEKITEIVNQKKKVNEDSEIVEYHVYDIPSRKDFSERIKDLEKLKKMLPKDSKIKIVETVILNNDEEVFDYMQRCLSEGYEGIMLRNLKGGYENKRTKNLQKLKEFEDAEFRIVGVEEGRGKLAGHAGSFICETEEGNSFRAKLKGALSKLKEYFDNFENYNERMLTVQFQGYTGKNKVPRFPVGLRIREDI